MGNTVDLLFVLAVIAAVLSVVKFSPIVANVGIAMYSLMMALFLMASAILILMYSGRR